MTVALREDFFHLFGSVAPTRFESAEEGWHAAGVDFWPSSLRVDQLEEPRTLFTHLIRPELVDPPVKIVVLFLRCRHAVEFTTQSAQ